MINQNGLKLLKALIPEIRLPESRIEKTFRGSSLEAFPKGAPSACKCVSVFGKLAINSSTAEPFIINANLFTGR